MKIRGVNVKGIKKTVGEFNKMSLEKRESVNIWYDELEHVVLILDDLFFLDEEMEDEKYTDELGLEWFRYSDVTDCIKSEYPWWDNDNIHMAQLRFVLNAYLV